MCAWGEVRSGGNKWCGQAVGFDVGTLLQLHCPDLRSQMQHRCCFYRQARLVKSGIVRVEAKRLGQGSSDLMGMTAELDRRMVDFCVGLDTELEDLVEARTGGDKEARVLGSRWSMRSNKLRCPTTDLCALERLSMYFEHAWCLLAMRRIRHDRK